ncbi:MAG: hypothetical protein HC800_13140 [Phormidesmis sp. RL_2_1]|nr:hypothetical protein [Phormidesmis sp. RL_2_1]
MIETHLFLAIVMRQNDFRIGHDGKDITKDNAPQGKATFSNPAIYGLGQFCLA